jgi:hypothetical protein
MSLLILYSIVVFVLKCIRDLNARPETQGETLDIGNDFLNRFPIAQENRSKN